MAQVNPGLVYAILAGAMLAVGLRVLGRTLYPSGMSGDVFFHLHCAEAIRNNSLRLPENLPGFIWKTGYTYPPLFHLVLALFPERYRKFFERYSSLIFDLAQAVFVWYTARAFFAYVGKTPTMASTKALAVAGTLLVSPMLNAYISGPRSMTGTGRTLGEVLFVVAVSSTLLWEMGRGHGFALLAVFCYGLVPLSSKFGLQSLVALFVVLAVAQKFTWCFIIVVGMGIGFFVSKGHLLKVIKGQLNHSHFYFQFLQSRKAGMEALHGVKTYYSRLIEALKPPGIWRKLVKWMLGERCATHVVIFHNFHVWTLVLCLLFSLTKLEELLADPVLKSFFILSLAPLFPLILTTLKPFRFLGENYRYLEYYQWVYWLLLCYSSARLFPTIGTLAAVFTCGLLVIQMRYVRDWERAYSDSEPFFERVRRLYTGTRAHTISGTYYELCYRGQVEVLLWGSNMVLGHVPYDELDELFNRFPFPREGNKYQQVLKRYGVELVLCHKYALERLSPSIFEGLDEIDMPPNQYRLFRLTE